jgi:hypothetical protein
MTTATRILLVRARTPDQIEKNMIPGVMGVLSLKADGWHFMPWVSGRKPSRVGKPTWEKAIPRWTGGLDGTESRRMEPRQTVTDALASFTKQEA